jgi:hypothetical protein
MSKHEAELHFEALEAARNRAYIDSLNLRRNRSIAGQAARTRYRGGDAKTRLAA